MTWRPGAGACCLAPSSHARREAALTPMCSQSQVTSHVSALTLEAPACTQRRRVCHRAHFFTCLSVCTIHLPQSKAFVEASFKFVLLTNSVYRFVRVTHGSRRNVPSAVNGGMEFGRARNAFRVDKVPSSERVRRWSRRRRLPRE